MARSDWKTISRRATRRLRSFGRDTRGGIAIIFGIAIVPVAFLSLVMIDYSRASTAKQSLQEALDAATLLAARSSAITATDIDAMGDKALTAQLTTSLGISGLTPDAGGHVAGATFTPNSTDNSVTGTVTASVTPIVSNLFLGGPISINATSTVVRAVNKLEIAMVLDTTGSMQGSKITNLITAATNFVTTMETAASRSTETNPVKIAIVPFSTTVKVSAPVDMKNYDDTNHKMTGFPTWLDGRAQSTPYNYDIFTTASSTTRVDRFSLFKSMTTSWGGCVENRAAPYDTTDDAPDTTKPDTLFTPFFWADAPDQSFYKNVSLGTFLNDYLPDGYSKTANSTTLPNFKVAQGNPAKYTVKPKTGTWSQGSAYGANLDYGPNGGCAMQQMKPLSTDFTALRTTISGLVASGETNIPIGLAWGWHAISPNLPLANGVAYNTPKTTKIIVLMTDGDNTMNNSGDNNDSWYHGYGFVWQNKLGITSTGSATTKLNDRMNLLCTNIKAKNIVIYTVGVGVSTSSKTLLTNCATVPGQYYDVNASGTNMDAAFSAIAGSIQNLRISK